jgi:nucleolar protein 4
MRAVEKLHAHTFKGSSLSVILKKRHDTLLKSGKAGAHTQKGGPTAAPNRNSRLIVRNLPWNVSFRTVILVVRMTTDLC